MSNTSAALKLAKHRLSTLQLAEALGNVSEACRRRGISRTQFYDEYKRRFQTHGLEGLKDLPPIHKSHPQITPPEVVEKILELSLANPMWGCVRLSDQLKLMGITDNGREYCGRAHHSYELYLALNDIQHRTTKVGTPQTNGFVERFNRTVLDEFFRPAFRKKFYESVEQLQEDLDGWLHHYNHERPHRGYRKRGKRPVDTVQEYIKSVRKVG